MASCVAVKDMREMARMSSLKVRLREGLQANVQRCFFNGHSVQSLPNTLNVSFAGVEGLAILLNLDLEGISVSSGSACLSGAAGPSPVLTAMGLEESLARSAIRFSLGPGNTQVEIDVVVDTLARLVARLRIK